MRPSWPLVCLVLAAVQASSQQPVPQQPAADQSRPNTYRMRLNEQRVVLDVVVTDSKGQIVRNLKKDDFEVFDDKAPQVIESLDAPPAQTAANPPIHSTAELDRVEPNAPVTLIVLDEINTRFQDEAFARYSLKRFLDKQGETLDHPTLLGAVDMNHFTVLHDYTTSKQELLDALDHHFVAYPWHLEGTSWKAEQFNASFVALMEIAEATSGHPGHKSLLWVGRGFPPFDPSTLTQQENEGLKQVIEGCTNAMRDARVVLYTLDPAGVSMEPPELDSDGFISDPFATEVDFDAMARETGGHAFYGRNDVDKLIATSAEEGANFYTLSYRPSAPRTNGSAFHSIRVVMKNPALHAETREGYYSKVSGGGTVDDQPKRQIFDLALAAQSMMTYDGVHMSVQRVGGSPDQFRLSVNSGDLVWQESGARKMITRITVVAESFDKKGGLLNRAVKISTLQVGETAANTPDSATVALFASIPTKAPASQLRFLVRADASSRLGTVNLPIAGKSATDQASN